MTGVYSFVAMGSKANQLDKKGFEIVPDTFVIGYHKYASLYYDNGRKAYKDDTYKYKTIGYDILPAFMQATENVDYTKTSGSVTVKKGSTLSKEIRIPISSKADFEPWQEKMFRVQFSDGRDIHITLTSRLRTPVSNILPNGTLNLMLTGSKNINGKGNQLNNSILGNDGDNILDGMTGDDILDGLHGNDTLIGGDGFDYLDGGYGDDMLIGSGIGFGFGSPQIDILVGGDGNDTFVLGTKNNPFYTFVKEEVGMYVPINLDQLKAATGASDALAQKYLNPLNKAMEKFEINTPNRQRAFLANIAFESGNLADTTENISESRANALYGNPGNSLGNVKPGDGYRFRGRGLIQVTGREMYRQVGVDYLNIGNKLVNDPDYVNSSPEMEAMVSGAWWAVKVKEKKIDYYADAGLWIQVSRIVKGSNADHDFNPSKPQDKYRLPFYEKAIEAIPGKPLGNSGSSDYAIIKDFDSGDKIQLCGTAADYIAIFPYQNTLGLFDADNMLIFRRESRNLVAQVTSNVFPYVADSLLSNLSGEQGLMVSTTSSIFQYV